MKIKLYPRLSEKGREIKIYRKNSIEFRAEDEYPKELKDYAKKLASIQPYLEKGWSIVSVDIINNTIHLYNPNLPYRKRNKHKRMPKTEQEFIHDISHALIFIPTQIPYILKGYSNILTPDEIESIEPCLPKSL